MAKKKTPEAPSFEQALERLEAIVQRLEDGELGLDEALAQYEEGVGLLRRSYDLLGQAERRIEVLGGVDAEGNPITEPFDDEATIDTAGAERRGRGAGGAGKGGGSRPSAGNLPPEGENDVDATGGLF